MEDACYKLFEVKEHVLQLIGILINQHFTVNSNQLAF